MVISPVFPVNMVIFHRFPVPFLVHVDRVSSQRWIIPSKPRTEDLSLLRYGDGDLGDAEAVPMAAAKETCRWRWRTGICFRFPMDPNTALWEARSILHGYFNPN